jgi:rRNA maturation endonuclease Nob1
LTNEEAKHFAEWMLVRRVENVFDGEIERYNIVRCTNCGREQRETTPFCPICGYEMTVDWSVKNG